jgi:hypothetical protein
MHPNGGAARSHWQMLLAARFRVEPLVQGKSLNQPNEKETYDP